MKLKKVITSILIVVLLFSFSIFLTSCNKDDDNITIGDIFKSYSSEEEFSSYQLEISLPEAWSVYTKSSTTTSAAANVYSDVGYNTDIDGFIVNQINLNALSVVKCNDKKSYFKDSSGNNGPEGMIFSSSVGISEIRIKDGLIACKFKNGTAGVYNYNGKTVLSREKINCGTSVHLDAAIKILDSGLIAVEGAYDTVNGIEGYISIYRPQTNSNVSEAGLFICNIENDDEDLDYIDGFDSSYVSVVGNSEGSYIYYIPSSTVGKLAYTDNGFIETNEDVSDYYSEILYLGNGKFFIHEDWTVEKSDDYLYYDSSNYYKFVRYIYYPQDDSLTKYTDNSDKVFLSLSNNFYDGKNGIDTNGYLNDGFTYASYGLYIVNKIAYYDQYILDSDLNIIMSLTGNFGVELSTQTKSKVGYYDLCMTQVDGYYYIPLTPSDVRIYNSNGDLVGKNDSEYSILTQQLSNNVLVTAIEDPDDDSSTLYGGYNVKGEQIIAFKYSNILTFRGNYSAGKRSDSSGNETYYIIGADGCEVTEMSDGTTPLADIATSSSSSTTYLVKNGCYMFKYTKDDTTLFGIKNFNPDTSKNTVMPAFLETGSILYAPSSAPENVFVFELISSGTYTKYNIYRLI